MKKTFLSACSALLAVMSGQAIACSCGEVDIRDVFEESEDIVVARVTDIVQLQQAQSPSSEAPTALPVSDIWLIFGGEPYELSLCSRSSPLDVRGADDLELRNLLKRQATQDEP